MTEDADETYETADTQIATTETAKNSASQETPGGGSAGVDAAGSAARSAEKDPKDWVTGGEPATGPQESYLSTLAREAGEDSPQGLTKAEASEQIDRLQEQTGRG